MKKIWLVLAIVLLSTQIGFGQIISQYVETESGSNPKGIEIWNNSASELDFSINNLLILQGTNGAALTGLPGTLINTGTLDIGGVLVIGTPDLGTYLTDQGLTTVLFISYGFSFNGDDALGVSYGGSMTDIFGNPGSDPGSEWNGNGVSTLNQNIQLLQSISDGDLDGWTNPSSRFELVSSVPSTTGGLSGFGSAPVIYDEPTNHVTSFSASVFSSSQIDLSWTDATGSQFPSGYLIRSSTVGYGSIATPVDGTPIDNDDANKNIGFGIESFNWSGLTSSTTYYFKIFPYTNYGTSINYKIDGSIPQTTETTSSAPSVNAWINEFHYDNSGTDVNEFVEVVIENPGLYDLTDFQLDLYNGNDNQSYDIKNIGSEFTTGSTFNEGGSTFTIYYYQFPSNGIQNGSPDGLALSFQLGLIQFLSYEGTITAADGPAISVTSTDIGIMEGSGTGVDWSLGLVGSGTSYNDYAWDTLYSTTLGEKNIDQALPVELTSFTAIALGKGTRLEWETATEVNNYGFDVERTSTPLGTTEGIKWEKIGFVEGHGNSNSPKVYSFIDETPLFGEVRYRLKQLDTDGAYEYSDVVTVVSHTLAKYELHQNHPNPFNPSTKILFTLPDVTRVKVVVYNSLGQKVSELLNEQKDAGYHKVDFDGSNLSSGMYFYRLETENYSKTMKMMLIK